MRRRIKVVVCSPEMDGTSKLYFGDNLNTLRGHGANASIDPIYRDLPLNSNASYNGPLPSLQTNYL